MTAVQPDEPMPTIEELTVPELTVSSPVLKAGAHHFGKFCDYQSKVYTYILPSVILAYFLLNMQQTVYVTSLAIFFFK